MPEKWIKELFDKKDISSSQKFRLALSPMRYIEERTRFFKIIIRYKETNQFKYIIDSNVVLCCEDLINELEQKEKIIH